MTFNGVMAVILCHFTEFVYDVVVKQLPPFQNLLLLVYDHINTIRDQDSAMKFGFEPVCDQVLLRLGSSEFELSRHSQLV